MVERRNPAIIVKASCESYPGTRFFVKFGLCTPDHCVLSSIYRSVSQIADSPICHRGRTTVMQGEGGPHEIHSISARVGCNRCYYHSCACVCRVCRSPEIGITGSTHSQNFNTLASSGTSNTFVPTGWAFSESGTNADSTYTAGIGSSITGDVYSFGASGSTERAFGGLQSGNLLPTIGVQFRNDTGKTIGRLTISYNCEMWRQGTSGRTDRLDFQYSLDATSLTSGTWTDIDALDCNGTDTGIVGAKDGNSLRTAVSSSILGLGIANGTTFWLRWNDVDATNADDGLAVDDFSLTAQGPNAVKLGELSASTPASSLAVLPVLGLVAAGGLIAWRRRK